MDKPSSISDADWRARLSPEQYRVARQGGTERPFSGEHYLRTERGDYHCICCGSLLFHSDTKFDAGCGWPSFWAEAAGERIKRLRDTSHGTRQGGQQLGRHHDAVEVARYRPQAIHRRHATILKIFHLLQYRVRCARDEYITRQQQHGQAVDMGHRSGSDQIGTTGADGGADRHHAAAKMRLGIGGSGQCHALLVVGAQGRQHILRCLQGFAQTGHIAVAEYGPHAAKQPLPAAIRHGDKLRGQIAHQRLGHGETYGFHIHSPGGDDIS